MTSNRAKGLCGRPLISHSSVIYHCGAMTKVPHQRTCCIQDKDLIKFVHLVTAQMKNAHFVFFSMTNRLLMRLHEIFWSNCQLADDRGLFMATGAFTLINRYYQCKFYWNLWSQCNVITWKQSAMRFHLIVFLGNWIDISTIVILYMCIELCKNELVWFDKTQDNHDSLRSTQTRTKFRNNLK